MCCARNKSEKMFIFLSNTGFPIKDGRPLKYFYLIFSKILPFLSSVRRLKIFSILRNGRPLLGNPQKRSYEAWTAWTSLFSLSFSSDFAIICTSCQVSMLSTSTSATLSSRRRRSSSSSICEYKLFIYRASLLLPLFCPYVTFAVRYDFFESFVRKITISWKTLASK